MQVQQREDKRGEGGYYWLGHCNCPVSRSRIPFINSTPEYHEMEIWIQSNVTTAYGPYAACIICGKSNPVMHCNVFSEIKK